jgi:DNA topoisomerase-1
MKPALNPDDAKTVGLRYVNDVQPGFTRRRNGKGFSFKDQDGNTVRDADTIARFRALVIPPAWRDVWICPYSNGHIQATGFDERGRKQYIYHEKWRQARDENKYERMLAFAQVLPKIRRATKRDLKQRGLPRTKVLATIVQLLEKTMIRIGNEQYAKENKSFGLTTMRNRHAKVRGAKVHFDFKGKSSVHHEIGLQDQTLARVISKLQDLPGQELFQYQDEDGEIVSVGSGEVNEYLKQISGDEFTAKDFRTWSGTVLASLALQEFEKFDSHTQAKKNIVRAIEDVAAKLGNTPSICRKCYVHPAILESYLDGSMLKTMQQTTEARLKKLRGLSAEEAAVLAFLQKRLKAETRKGKGK